MTILPSLWSFVRLHLAYCAAPSRTRPYDRLSGGRLCALGDTAAPMTRSSWASWCSFSSQTVLSPLPLFQSHCGRWNWQPFLVFRLLFRQEKTSPGLWHQDARLEGAPASFHIWRWTCFRTQPVSCSHFSCLLNSTSGSLECKSSEGGGVLLLFSANMLPIKVPRAEVLVEGELCLRLRETM